MGNVGWVGLFNVPALSGTMLFVLALLLAVITLRTLRAKGGTGRISGILLVAGASATLAFLAVEDVPSSVMGIIVDDPDCRGNPGKPFPSDGPPALLTNNCPNRVKINVLDPGCMEAEVSQSVKARVNICTLGGTVGGNGGTCLLPTCAT